MFARVRSTLGKRGVTTSYYARRGHERGARVKHHLMQMDWWQEVQFLTTHLRSGGQSLPWQ